jgi:titin
MGLQIVNFPGNGIQSDGNWNQFGGSRAIGAGPIGQGNLTSGNGICGIVTGGWYTKVLGNLVGTDITGTQAYPNYDGIFVTDWGFYVTVGSTNPDERNIASGNNSINMDSWGDHTLIIGNIIGLDITGTKVVKYDSESNLTLEDTAKNTIVGGTTLEERNIISGAQSGVTFSDTTSYQNSVIGNYIGTDITGTKAVGNRSGGGIWACSHHRIGGTAEGEGNLISGNENAGTGLSGYGCSDNFILGNRIGIDVNGNPLPNGTGVDVNTGQRHGTIGGYTEAEGNLVVGGSISMRITGHGIKGCYFAGNTVINSGNLMIYLEDGASDCFIQNNTFEENNSNAVRVDYGTGNIIRSNTFISDKPWELILLLEGGNTGMPAPVVTEAKDISISGTACAFGRVEIYLYEKTGIVSLGFSQADEKGEFRFTNSESLSGKQVILLVTDMLNNTSAFSQPCDVS